MKIRNAWIGAALAMLVVPGMALAQEHVRPRPNNGGNNGGGNNGNHGNNRGGHENEHENEGHGGGSHGGGGGGGRTSAPELDPSAVGAALTLVSGGLLIVTGRRRKKTV